VRHDLTLTGAFRKPGFILREKRRDGELISEEKVN
jgi:hypothetical protein